MKSESFSKDLTSGLFVSLIALPLCMGIAIASGFPPSSGIVTAIVGGIVTSFAGGARLTIKGPAAGLIVIVIGAVTELADPSDPATGVARAAAVGVIAGALQVILGKFKGGALTELIPLSVIHGMLAAIGIIIISKQSHAMLGVTPAGKKPADLLLEIPHSIVMANPEITLIGVLAVVIMIFYPKIVKGFLQKIPAVLIVMGVAIGLGFLFHLGEAHDYEFFQQNYKVGPQYLIHLPSSLRESIFFPDWSHVLSGTSIKWVVFFFLVGSIESLLTVSAVNEMDPMKRRADPNKDLVALGLGNMCSGFLGGMPMISEIVRSKANVDSGAQSSWANFIHGALLLTYLCFLGSFLGNVPSAALAGVLVFVGFRLASPQTFKHAYHIGPEQFVFFALTCFLTVVEDLLIGVAAGLVAAYAFQLWKGARPADLFKAPVSLKKTDECIRVVAKRSALGSQFASFRKQLETYWDGSSEVRIDFSRCAVVDHGFLQKLDALKNEITALQVRVEGLEEHKALCAHPNATRVRKIAKHMVDETHHEA